MDLSSDFPNNKVHDAQAIIIELDKIIHEIKQKEAIIKNINTGLDNELKKLDLIIQDIHDLKKIISKLQNNINKLFNDLSIKLENKINNIKIPEPIDNTTSFLYFTGISTTIGIGIGLLLGLYWKK